MRHEGKERRWGYCIDRVNDILRIDLNVGALDQLQWRDFGKGLSMSRLAREGKRELILYRIAANAASDAVSEALNTLAASFILSLEAKSPMRPESMWKETWFFGSAVGAYATGSWRYGSISALWPEGVRIVD